MRVRRRARRAAQQLGIALARLRATFVEPRHHRRAVLALVQIAQLGPRELGRLAIALDQHALDFLLLRACRERRQHEDDSAKLHSICASSRARIVAAKASTSCPSATRSAIERMIVGTATTSMPSERTLSIRPP